MAAGDIVPIPGGEFGQTLAAASPGMIRAFVRQMMNAGGRGTVRRRVRGGQPGPGELPHGYRVRDWDTRAGTIELAIPRPRAGS